MEVGVRLTGEPHEAGGADREIGNGAAQPPELFAQRALPLGPAHAFQHAVTGVLDRHVQIRHDPGFAGHQLDQPLGETRGVNVEEAEPGDGRFAEQRFEQVRELRTAAPQVAPEMAQVLRDEVDLLRPLGLQRLRLAHQPLERLGAVLAAHQRDRAERAGVIAPFGDLEVADVVGAAQELADAGMRGDGIREQAPLSERGDELVQIGESQEEIDFRHLSCQLLLVALHQAADRHDRFDRRFLLELCRLQHRLDGLPLRRVDEPARVDEDDVGLGEVVGEAGAMPHQLPDQPLGVDGGFVAAEGDDAQFHPR